MRNNYEPNPISTGAYDSIPKTADEQFPTAEEERIKRMYLKHYKDETWQKFKVGGKIT